MNKSEVWLVDLEPTIGDEIKKTRPVVIVSANTIGNLALKVVVPFTDWKNHYTKFPWMTRIDPDTSNSLSKISAVDAFQVRSISRQRFIRRLGKLSTLEMQNIADALAVVLEIVP